MRERKIDQQPIASYDKVDQAFKIGAVKTAIVDILLYGTNDITISHILRRVEHKTWTENDQVANCVSELGETVNELRDYFKGKHRDGTPATREEVLLEMCDALFSIVTLMQIFRLNEGLSQDAFKLLVNKAVETTMTKLWRRVELIEK